MDALAVSGLCSDSNYNNVVGKIYHIWKDHVV